MKALFIITGLSTGGAEKQLLRLITYLQGKSVEVGVISLRQPGPVAQEIEEAGVPVWSLGLEGVANLPGALVGLMRHMRAFRPHILQGWMHHGNLAARLADRAAPGAKLVWGIRQSLDGLERVEPATRRVIRLCARCSGKVAAVVYNSATARVQFEAFGFVAVRAQVIDNGFEAEQFRPDPAARLSVRDELGLPPTAMLVGLVARYHPMKSHQVFLAAAARLAERRQDVRFVLVGQDVNPHNPALTDHFAYPALASRVHCLGRRDDLPRLTAAFDIASSSSRTEAFPNTLGEAMSCGVPVVATDVGDVRRIVGEAGIVVSVSDATALARAWETLLDDAALRHRLGQIGRQRVIDNFSVEAMGRRYLALYKELL